MNKEELIAYRNKLLEEQNKNFLKISIEEIENDNAKVNVLLTDATKDSILGDYKHIISEQKAVKCFEEKLKNVISQGIIDRHKFDTIDVELKFNFYTKNSLYNQLDFISDTVAITSTQNINEDYLCNPFVEITFSFFRVNNGVREKIETDTFLDKRTNILVNYNIFANNMYEEGFDLNRKSFLYFLKNIRNGEKIITSVDFTIEPEQKILKKTLTN